MNRRRGQLPERVQGQRGVEAEVEVEDQVEIQVTMQLRTHLPTQEIARLKTRLPVLRETRPRLRRGVLLRFHRTGGGVLRIALEPVPERSRLAPGPKPEARMTIE